MRDLWKVEDPIPAIGVRSRQRLRGQDGWPWFKKTVGM
jgi:hypothetical protein